MNPAPHASMSAMGISASLVVGRDGSTTLGNNSAGVSNHADRLDFLARRRSFDCIIIGGNTARSEPYSKTPVPLVIISRSSIHPLPENPQAYLWNTSLVAAIAKAKSLYGENILIEGGPMLVNELLRQDSIDDLYLTITPHAGGSNIFDWESALEKFAHVQIHEIDGTKFYHATN